MARASPHIIGGFSACPTVSAILVTAAKSPGEAIGKPETEGKLNECFRVTYKNISFSIEHKHYQLQLYPHPILLTALLQLTSPHYS